VKRSQIFVSYSDFRHVLDLIKHKKIKNLQVSFRGLSPRISRPFDKFRHANIWKQKNMWDWLSLPGGPWPSLLFPFSSLLSPFHPFSSPTKSARGSGEVPLAAIMVAMKHSIIILNTATMTT